jgi:tripartite-type tricarboxylate transporter receptor subunit TctC
MGQPVVIENRPGAASIIGAQVVKDSAPDGYTFLSSGMSTQAANPVLYTNLPYDPKRDFEEIGMFGLFPMIGLVRKDGPLRSVADIVSYAKANPDKLTFGHHAASSLVPVELIKARAGVAIRAVPYKNVTDISMNVAQGVIDFAFIDALSAAPALRSGLLVPIAVTTSKRFHALPEVPAVAETLPGYSMDGWLGLSAPAGTPKPILDRMNVLLRNALAEPEIKESFESRGLIPNAVTIEEQKAWVVADRERWVEWAGIAKIEPQAR